MNNPASIFNPTYKQKITQSLKKFLTGQQNELSLINTWGNDTTEKLATFTTQGKMIRGSLILFIHEAYTNKITHEAVLVATAIELLHSSLLIHDDIMDQDKIRRGHKTIFAQYESLGKTKKLKQTSHFGQSMGICAGDIGFFLGCKLLSSLTDTPTSQTIHKLCMSELVNVGIAQMQDVYVGHTTESITEETIENVYRYKTGRYTFSLPMTLGAILARQKTEIANKLEKIGQTLGLIFQLKDDELSIFGKQEITGKPEGSDIRENKKTLYRLYLYQKATPEEQKKLDTIFGQKQLTTNNLTYIRNQITKLKIQEIINNKLQNLYNKATQSITDLEIPKPYKQQLYDLLKYSIERTN